MDKKIVFEVGYHFQGSRLRYVGEIAGRPRKVICVCECGTRKGYFLDNLRRGTTRSCGCLNSELSSSRNSTHGGSVSYEYDTWLRMKARCSATSGDADIANYALRGITVCERWSHSFENFYADMGDRPSDGHSLDRIDNDGNYEPGNCRWATRKEQNRNKRSNVWITAWGITKLLVEWADEYRIHRECLRQRVYRGWSPERALTTPVKQ